MAETDDILTVVDYDPRWPDDFTRLAARARVTVGASVRRVEHVGSTAVPGLAAKPVIDLDVVVESKVAVGEAVRRLESIGYRHEGDLGIPGREAFRWPDGEPRHHLYLLAEDAPELARHLTFRDALRASHRLRDEYARLKRASATRHATDRTGYTRSKSSFIEAALACSGKAMKTVLRRLDARSPIQVSDAFRKVNAALLDLLQGFGADDWSRPTVHKDRSVKDLTAHLLHGSLRRVTGIRDGYRSPTSVSINTAEDLTKFIQEDNRAFMNGMSRVSPEIIIELIARYDPEVVRLFEGLDPEAPGLGVVWAGEWQSKAWFDIAREYTEKWHHQQQLRDATGRPPLYEPELLEPVLETFARGLPFAYRRIQAQIQAPSGTAISIFVRGPVETGWTLRRASDAWTLWSPADPDSDTSIEADADLLWRVWTKGVSRAEAIGRLRTVGEGSYAEPLANFVAIMA